jgi:hypothetical protein
MSRTWWLIGLAAAGVAAIVLIGLLSSRDEESKTEALSSLCSSLETLQGSVGNLTGLPSSATQTDYQNAVTGVQDDWDQVKSDAEAVSDAPTGELDSAWDDFTSAVKDVPNDASVQAAVSDVTQSADQLVSTAKSTASEIDC